MISLFALPGMDESGTTLFMMAFIVALVYLLIYGWQHSSKIVKDGAIRHFPKRFYVEHMGYPTKVICYDEYDFIEVDKDLKIYDSKATAFLQDGHQMDISLTSLSPSSWQAIDGGLRDKRIYRIRTQTEIEQQNVWLWKAVAAVRKKLQTLEEELREERGTNEQTMQRYANIAKTLREHLSPPQQFFPRMGRMGSQGGVTLNLDQQGQGDKGAQ